MTSSSVTGIVSPSQQSPPGHLQPSGLEPPHAQLPSEGEVRSEQKPAEMAATSGPHRQDYDGKVDSDSTASSHADSTQYPETPRSVEDTVITHWAVSGPGIFIDSDQNLVEPVESEMLPLRGREQAACSKFPDEFDSVAGPGQTNRLVYGSVPTSATSVNQDSEPVESLTGATGNTPLQTHLDPSANLPSHTLPKQESLSSPRPSSHTLTPSDSAPPVSTVEDVNKAVQEGMLTDSPALPEDLAAESNASQLLRENLNNITQSTFSQQRLDSGQNQSTGEETCSEVIHPEHMMSLESGASMMAPPSNLRISEDLHPSHPADKPSSRPQTRKYPLKNRGHGGELSYRLEDRMEELPRSWITSPRRVDEDTLYDLSCSDDDDLFSTDAQQRAAWRARAGDFGLPSSMSADYDRRATYSHLPDIRTSDLPQRRFVSFSSPQQPNIMSDIDKLRQEHARMMQLLERSRDRSTPLLSQLLRTRSASPRMTHAESGSSSSGSMVTVIAGRGSVRESPVTVSASQGLPISHKEIASGHGAESSASPAVSDTAHCDLNADPSRSGTQEIEQSTKGGIIQTNQEEQGSVNAETNPSDVSIASTPRLQVDQDPAQEDMDTLSTVPALKLSDLSPRYEQTSLNTSADLHSPESQISSSRSPHLADSPAVAISVGSPRWADSPFDRPQELEVSRPPLDTRDVSRTTGSHPAYSMARRRQDVAANTVESPRSELRRKLENQDEVTIRVVSEFPPDVLAPATPNDSFADSDAMPDELIKTPRSLGGDNVPPLDHQFMHPSFISKGVAAKVDISDDFTQTDAEEDSLQVSQLDASRDSVASSGTSETRRIRAELDRLQKERVEIIELLSLKYLPASFTVELLEAKLNYCLGQTDMLLASLEKAWAEEELSDSTRRHRAKRHEEFLTQYRQQCEQTRQDLRVCMEEARRIHTGARGRRMARTRDVIAMQRRAQIEAFKEERRREQALFEQCRNMSPEHSDMSSMMPQDTAEPGQAFDPRFMTPKEHKEHLVRLRRSVVAASSEELNELRSRSRSSSFSRSPTPDRSVSPASSVSNLYQSRESSTSLSPERFLAPRSASATPSTPSYFPTRPVSSTHSSPGRSASTPHSCPGRPASASCSSPRRPSQAMYSTLNLPVSESPHRIPRLVLPSADPSYYRDHSFPRQSQSLMSEPRSNSCGPGVSPRLPLDRNRLSQPDIHSGLYQGDASFPESGSLDPEQLLRESYEARQLNRHQISKAQEALRLLERHREGFRSQMR